MEKSEGGVFVCDYDMGASVFGGSLYCCANRCCSPPIGGLESFTVKDWKCGGVESFSEVGVRLWG